MDKATYHNFTWLYSWYAMIQGNCTDRSISLLLVCACYFTSFLLSRNLFLFYFLVSWWAYCCYCRPYVQNVDLIKLKAKPASHFHSTNNTVFVSLRVLKNPSNCSSIQYFTNWWGDTESQVTCTYSRDTHPIAHPSTTPSTTTPTILNHIF